MKSTSNKFFKKKFLNLKIGPSSVLVVNIMYKVLVIEVINVIFHTNICKNYHEWNWYQEPMRNRTDKQKRKWR